MKWIDDKAFCLSKCNFDGRHPGKIFSECGNENFIARLCFVYSNCNSLCIKFPCSVMKIFMFMFVFMFIESDVIKWRNGNSFDNR